MFEESPGFLLLQVSNIWQRKIKKCIKEYKLTQTQFIILVVMYSKRNEHEFLNLKKIAMISYLDSVIISIAIETLINKKMVVKIDDSKENKTKIVFLNKKGIDLMENVMEKIEDLNISFFKDNNIEILNTELKTLRI